MKRHRTGQRGWAVALRSVLFDDAAAAISIVGLRAGVATGRLSGGCLSSLTSLVGTPWIPNLAGHILFLEDSRESPYKIDRMLTQLRDSGTVADLAGLVFGTLHECEDLYNDIGEVVLDALDTTNYPIAVGIQTGHGPRNLALPFGVEYRLDCDLGSLTTV